jgi:putative membrane protein
MMMGYWNDGMSWWGWLGMTVFMVIFWGLVIWGIVALIRSLNTPGTRVASVGQGSTTPDAILAERVASGEIDDKVYAHKREILQSTDQSSDDPGNENTSRERAAEAVAR